MAHNRLQHRLLVKYVEPELTRPGVWPVAWRIPIHDDAGMHLNRTASKLCYQLIDQATSRRIAAFRDETGVQLVDCGVHVRGGLEAGLQLAQICMAGLGEVRLAPRPDWPGPTVTVSTDQPIAACMASQYAGWQIAGERFFAMGSGPMRALRGREKLFEDFGHTEKSDVAVGVLESGKLPPEDVCHHVSEECCVDPENLTLATAPTASLAGSIQVVARSIETALHKMHEIGFDLERVINGFGSAPLPPVAGNDLEGIGRTNDAVLYGGEVTLWVTGDDDILSDFGPRIPSSASSDHGSPFSEIFERYDRDFYKIDPLLFSPAVVNLLNVETGRTHRHGELRLDLLRRSLESA